MAVCTETQRETLGQTDNEENHPHSSPNLTVNETATASVPMTPGSENEMISTHTTPESVKEEVNAEPYHCAHRAHARALSLIIGMPDAVNENRTVNNQDSDSDDCLIVDDTNIIPMPLPSTTEGFIKQNNDIVSGDKPFIQTVRIKNRINNFNQNIEHTIIDLFQITFINSRKRAEFTKLENDV